MNIETTINTLPFPVFACDKSGMILYKNRIATRYIGPLRKGSYIMRYLSDDHLPTTCKLITIKSDTPYPKALTVADDKELLFLAFSRLQYPDAERISRQISETIGKTPTAFLCMFEHHQSFLRENSKFPRRIYTDLIRLTPQKTEQISKAYLLGELIEPLFSQMEGVFCALGFRIRTKIGESFVRHAPVCLDRYDLLFVFGRLLYAVMKLSADGDIEITLSASEKSNHHRLRFYTHIEKPMPESAIAATEFFRQSVPECCIELLLTSDLTSFGENAAVSFDSSGGIAVTYDISCLAPTLCVHSPVFSEDLKPLFMRLFAEIGEMLKENSSSCRYFPAGN